MVLVTFGKRMSNVFNGLLRFRLLNSLWFRCQFRFIGLRSRRCFLRFFNDLRCPIPVPIEQSILLWLVFQLLRLLNFLNDFGINFKCLIWFATYKYIMISLEMLHALFFIFDIDITYAANWMIFMFYDINLS